MYSSEIVETKEAKFYAEIFITSTGYIVRETKEVSTREQAQTDAQAWITKKLQRDTK